MIADMEPVSVGTATAQFERMFTTRLSPIDMEIIFHPRQNAVSLEFRYEYYTYRHFWDEASRGLFTAALERYKADYAARNLDSRFNRTRSAYGSTNTRLEWEAFSFGLTRGSSPGIEIGYRFRNDSPFFTILIREAKEDADPTAIETSESPQIVMHFTRAQADELAKLFNQTYLLEVIYGTQRNNPVQQELIEDDYIEYGE
jgi:hypothetical protein